MMKTLLKLTVLLFIVLLSTKTMKSQANDFREMIKYAVKAPSGHNTQPWKFRIEDDRIEIHPDFSKKLPIVDGDDRELFISLGCALETLCIAANEMNYSASVKVENNGVIEVWLDKSDTIASNPLFNQIVGRQTNRNVYENRLIAHDTLSACISDIKNEEHINIYFWNKQSPFFDTLKHAVIEGNILQMGDKAFRNELKSWMRFNKKHSESKKDGLSYAVFGAPNLPAFISKPAMSSFLNSKKQNKGDIKKIDSSSHFILFTTKENNIESWINLGRYLQRFLLRSAQANIAHAYTNQPCEEKKLAIKLQNSLPINNEIPQILLRIGYAKKAPYSKRKNIDEVIISE